MPYNGFSALHEVDPPPLKNVTITFAVIIIIVIAIIAAFS